MTASETTAWQRALVTGASSGIGEAFARLLAARGTDLVVVARRFEVLDTLASDLVAEHGIDVEVLPADLSDREQLATVVDRLQADPAIDLLVNNAGFGQVGDFLSLDPDGEVSVVDVNVTAVNRLAHAAGGAMASRGRGGILNVSSIAGFSPSPRSATYGASKAFVTSLSEALHVELGPQGVVVSCLCPGLTRTGFQDRTGYRPQSMPDRMWQDPDRVAEAGLRALASGQAVAIPGLHNKVAAGLARAAPGGLVRRAAKLLADFNGK